MADLTPLENLVSRESGTGLPLPEEIARLYGPLAFPLPNDRLYVISNFVTSLDGKISLNLPGQKGGGEISGHNAHDRMVMGLLRAVASAVLITSTSLRVAGKLIWTAETIYPPLADAYLELRHRLGLPPSPLHVVVTGRGDVDAAHRVFQSGEVPSLILTTKRGEDRVETKPLPPSVPVIYLEPSGQLDAAEITEAVWKYLGQRPGILLSEGGAHLHGTLLDGNCLDELFLTLAPQAAGNDEIVRRPSLVEGHVLAPGKPRWAELMSAKLGGNHLLLRYRFPTEE